LSKENSKTNERSRKFAPDPDDYVSSKSATKSATKITKKQLK